MDGIMTYNPKQVIAAFGNHAVTGYAEDNFIVIEPLGDGVTSKAGCDGEIVRSIDPNNRFSVKVTLLASSPTHRFLQQQFQKDKDNGSGMFPIIIKDLTGADKFSCESAWVTKPPATTKSKEAQNKEWTLETGQSDFQYV